MDIKIREHIKNNFKDSNLDEVKASIEESIKTEDEVVLPGMGVFFEILWNNSDENSKEYIVKTIHDAIKK